MSLFYYESWFFLAELRKLKLNEVDYAAAAEQTGGSSAGKYQAGHVWWFIQPINMAPNTPFTHPQII